MTPRTAPLRFAGRMERLGTETAFEVLARARELERQGRDIVHLEIGEPDFDTPRNVIEAAVSALRSGFTHYCPAAGLPELRSAIATEMKRTRGLDVSEREIVVTPGGKPIMFFLFLALVEKGDEILYPNPGFPIYESMIRFVGGTPVPIPILEERDFSFDADHVRRLVTDRTRLIVLNSPANPTGGIIDRETNQAIARLAEERNLFVLSDEIYSRILYEGAHDSIATIPGMRERTCILEGFSKTYAMTGWRLGYGVMPEALAERVTKLMINSNSCTATFTQKAGVEALLGPQDEVERNVATFRKRRDAIVDGLNAIPGFRCRRPRGAFYVFPSVKDFGVPSRQLASELLTEAGVACLSGTAFGAHGEGYLRFSYANSLENIEKALDRIRTYATARRR